MSLRAAGWTAASFGLMNPFARALGGIVGNRVGMRAGLAGRVAWLFVVILLGGLLLMAFSRMRAIGPATGVRLVFSLFVQMGCGATFAVVPLINKQAVGSVSGIVGAGGNAAAVAAGFLFKGSMAWPTGAAGPRSDRGGVILPGLGGELLATRCTGDASGSAGTGR